MAASIPRSEATKNIDVFTGHVADFGPFTSRAGPYVTESRRRSYCAVAVGLRSVNKGVYEPVWAT